MKKLFVSCPMNGKTFEEIVEVRKKAIKLMKEKFPNEEFEMLKLLTLQQTGTRLVVAKLNVNVQWRMAFKLLTNIRRYKQCFYIQ